MKKKHFKVVNIAAVFIFIAAFFLNLQTGFNGSSGFLGIPAIAQGTGTGGGSGTGTGSGSGSGNLWFINKGDCSIIVKGKATTTIDIKGITFTFPESGELTVTFTRVETNCAEGGPYQCEYYSCSDFWG